MGKTSKHSFQKYASFTEMIFSPSHSLKHIWLLWRTNFKVYKKTYILFSSILSAGEKLLMSNAVTLGKLILVMPATDATSERSFSALRRVKTYLRGTMRQDRLNYTMTLHTHKDIDG